MPKPLDEYLSLNYTAVIIDDISTDGEPCFRAECLELPGCMSHGYSRDEALANLDEAKRLHIESLLELGLVVPEPISPFTTTSCSSPTLNLIISGNYNFRDAKSFSIRVERAEKLACL